MKKKYKNGFDEWFEENFPNGLNIEIEFEKLREIFGNVRYLKPTSALNDGDKFFINQTDKSKCKLIGRSKGQIVFKHKRYGIVVCKMQHLRKVWVEYG